MEKYSIRVRVSQVSQVINTIHYHWSWVMSVMSSWVMSRRTSHQEQAHRCFSLQHPHLLGGWSSKQSPHQEVRGWLATVQSPEFMFSSMQDPNTSKQMAPPLLHNMNLASTPGPWPWQNSDNQSQSIIKKSLYNWNMIMNYDNCHHTVTNFLLQSECIRQGYDPQAQQFGPELRR